MEDPRKSEAKPDISKVGPGHNGPDRDAVLFLAGQLAAARGEKAAAAKKESGIKKKLINAGVTMGVFDDVLTCLEEGPDAVFERLSQFKLYAGWFDLPVGQQLQLFANPKEGAAVSQEDLLKRADQAGYDLALMGKQPDEQAYQPNTDLGRAHDAGWERGKKVLTEKFMQLNEENAQAEKQAKADAEAKAKREADKAAEKKKREETKAANAKRIADLKAKKDKDKADRAKAKADKAAAKAAKKNGTEQAQAH